MEFVVKSRHLQRLSLQQCWGSPQMPACLAGSFARPDAANEIAHVFDVMLLHELAEASDDS